MDRKQISESIVVDRGQPRRANGQVLRAVVASTVGTSIEWYDFFLYGTMAALVFPRVFFPKSDPYTGVMEAFGTYFVGFAARPIGAAIFGHYGDRMGRKATLVVTLLLMGLATFAIGLLPTYQTLGFLGGFLVLAALRTCQGMGVGGEWGGSVVLSMEWGHDRPRGFITSWPQFGVAVGLLLSNAVVAATSLLTGSAFLTWGWRIPFLLSILLVGVGLYIRLGILESPLFARLAEERRIERAPVAEVLRRNWREITWSALARMPEQAPFYLFTVFVLTYGVQTLHMSRNLMVLGTLTAAALGFLTLPSFGYLSDRIGRRRVYLGGVVATALIAFPYFGLLNTAVPLVVFLTVALSLVPHDAQYGPQAALISEQFTGRLRYSGSSLGYQLASLVAGGPASLVAAWLIRTYHSGYAISWYIVGCAVVGFVAVLRLRDRSQEDITVEYDEREETAREAAGRPSLA